ncbi:hypothetical protein DRJ16_04930 [Candidatus Woesearchaeota archaeon]|nr:MAG: hypothetical protein DRJ16_04930 [Candidatus Woesearchaeota archaeon]
MTLKTLKDIQHGLNEEDYTDHNKYYSDKQLRAEAVKWYHRSDGDKHKFILEFFNLTEEDLK